MPNIENRDKAMGHLGSLHLKETSEEDTVSCQSYTIKCTEKGRIFILNEEQAGWTRPHLQNSLEVFTDLTAELGHHSSLSHATTVFLLLTICTTINHEYVME